MDAIVAIRTRRSVRSFADRAVPRDLIAELIADAAHAPFTPIAKDGAWCFTVIEGRARIADYGARALEYARANRPQLRGYEWTERAGFSVFHGAPVVIIIAGREALPVALEECTRAGQLLDIAGNARGLGLCWVGAPDLWLRDSAVREELGVPEGWRPYTTFAVGYAAEGVAAARAERPPLLIDWREG